MHATQISVKHIYPNYKRLTESCLVWKQTKSTNPWTHHTRTWIRWRGKNMSNYRYSTIIAMLVIRSYSRGQIRWDIRKAGCGVWAEFVYKDVYAPWTHELKCQNLILKQMTVSTLYWLSSFVWLEEDMCLWNRF